MWIDAKQSHRDDSRRLYTDALTIATADRRMLPDRALGRDVDDIPLGKELNRVYDQYYWAAHSLKARAWLQAAFLFNLMLMVFDIVLAPHLLMTSLIVRGVATSALLIMLHLAWGRQRPRWVQGATFMIVAVIFMTESGVLGAMGGSALFERYLSIGLFSVATAVLFFPIEFRWTLASLLVAIAIHFGFLAAGPITPALETILTSVFFSTAILSFATTRKAAIRSQWKSFKSKIRELRDQEELTRLYDELQLVANLDPLTGIQNRRATQAHIDTIWNDGTYPKSAIAFLMVDIDDFKQLNDSFGHTAGDTCIKAVADEIREILRDSDIVSRYGGEEFLVVLTETSAAHAFAVAERIRVAIESLRLADPGSATATKVTISIGLAIWQGDASAEMLIQRADEALYEAKRNGKNRVAMAMPMVDEDAKEPAADSGSRQEPAVRQETRHVA